MNDQSTGPDFRSEPAVDPRLDPSLWVWGTHEEQPRLLHAMVRVRQLDVALKFYCDGLGMRVISSFDSEQGRFSLRFLSFTDFASGPAIELTHNWDRTEDYTHGSGYGHIAIGIPDIHAACKRLEAAGGTITVQPKHMVPGAPALAFVKDPDGYAIELIQTHHG
jgi:lactoylglutathione lyase